MRRFRTNFVYAPLLVIAPVAILAAALLTLLGHPLQTPVELPDPLTEQTPVGLQLRLTRPAQTDAALLPLQVGPAADQPRGQVFELCQLHLELALETARSLGEDVQDQAGAVEHPTLKRRFQVPLDHRR